MKTVFSNREIAHVFASNTQEHGRTSNGSMFFNSTTIYSYGYHFPIAKRVIKEGREFMLFTTRSYSITTAKHINYVAQATNHIPTILCYDPEASHLTNFREWYRSIADLLPALAKARKPQMYLSAIDRLLSQAKDYARFFDITLTDDLIKIEQDVRDAEFLKDVKNTQKAQEEERKREEQAIKEAYLKAHLVTVNEWRMFEIQGSLYNRMEGIDYLRFNAEKQRIQTSQGIEIPLAIAKDLFTYIMETVAKGGCTECNKTVLDRYQVRSISDRDVKIGCHTILISEIKEVAKAAGII